MLNYDIKAFLRKENTQIQNLSFPCLSVSCPHAMLTNTVSIGQQQSIANLSPYIHHQAKNSNNLPQVSWNKNDCSLNSKTMPTPAQNALSHKEARTMIPNGIASAEHLVTGSQRRRATRAHYLITCRVSQSQDFPATVASRLSLGLRVRSVQDVVGQNRFTRLRRKGVLCF